MVSCKKIIGMTFVFLSLTGCKEPFSENYLMEHPDRLKWEMERCEALISKSQDQEAQCNIVMHAAMSLSQLISEQQSDPEKFGQRIMDAESALVKAKEALRVAQQTVDSLKKSKNSQSAAELQTASILLQAAKITYQDQREEVKKLLAVIGMANPE